jgi:cation:H+ antiporter
MDLVTLVLFVIGLGLLIAGAEALVRGASRLAAGLGVAPLVIGLTVVAFGTSAPEVAVSLQSAFSGQADLAVGNVVGSNIFNVLFILGLSAAIAPLIVSRQLIRLDVPLMIGVSLLLPVVAWDLNISRLDGLILFAGIVVYTAFLVRQSRREAAQKGADEFEREYGEATKPRSARDWAVDLGLIVAGLGMLVLGSRWLVDGAVAIARVAGLSELIIGLTVVAAGTSLPEVATSVIASLKGERDIAVGNVVGSNTFNILGVLGLSAAVSPMGINVSMAVFDFDIPVMIAVAVACLPIFFTGYQIARWEGFVFLGYYVAYTAYLILDAAEHDTLPLFSNVMFLFVVPITALTLAILAARAFRQQRT